MNDTNDAFEDIGDTEGQPDGITNDSHDLPKPARAADRVEEFLRAYGDGIVYADEGDGLPPLYARDLEALRREHERDESDDLARQLDEARLKLTRFESMFGDVDTAQARLDGLEAINKQLRDENEKLRAQLQAPCGTCHPCNNWTGEEWRRDGRTPPSPWRWDETRSEVERLRGTVIQLRAALRGEAADTAPDRGCGQCYECVAPTWGDFDAYLVVCPSCGNKRCPHATSHRHACTSSNEFGQPGSRYRADYADPTIRTTEES